MTTITNFIHHSFLSTSQQPPIWSLSFTHNQYQPIRHYLIQHAITNHIPLLHLDLGLSTIKIVSNHQPIYANNQFTFYQTITGTPYIILRPTFNYKISQNFFSTIVNQLNQSIESNKIIFKGYDKIGLVIQGIQTAYNLSKSSKSLQYFLTELTNLHQLIGQTTVVVLPKLLPHEALFTLERTSACVTTIINSKQQNIFECTSTARRITGYSNQQTYIINLKEAKAKISKQNKNKEQKSNQQHQSMVKELGFTVGNKSQSQSNLKNLIYPHLNVQTKKQNCQDCNCKGDEGLIVLDDEQQDDDDVDI